MALLLIATLAATLAGLGMGSAGILVLYLVRVEGMPQLAAQGANLIFFLASGGISLLCSLRRTPPLWPYQLLLLPGGIAGVLLGTELARALPDGALRRAFGILLILCGLLGLFGKKKG